MGWRGSDALLGLVWRYPYLHSRGGFLKVRSRESSTSIDNPLTSMKGVSQIYLVLLVLLIVTFLVVLVGDLYECVYYGSLMLE